MFDKALFPGIYKITILNGKVLLFTALFMYVYMEYLYCLKMASRIEFVVEFWPVTVFLCFCNRY